MAVSRHSIIRNDRIEYSYWLVFDVEGGVAMSRTEPRLKPGERAMQCRAVLPKSLFEIATLKAMIEVAPDSPKPLQVDIKAAQENVLFDVTQQLQSLKVKYKMATGRDP